MKTVFQRADFLAELQRVSRAAAARSAIQTLGGVLLRASNDNVLLAATDTEIALQSQMEGKVEAEGSILVGARILVDILRVLEGDEVELEQRPDRGDISVSSGEARFAIKTLPAQDFPQLPSAPGADAMHIKAEVFARTIEQVARAASRDETRPVLTGVLVSVNEGKLQMVATDSYRLSVKESALGDQGKDVFEANVPARALQEIGRIVSETDAAEVQATAQENQIVFAIDGIVLSSRMIEGQFPNYQQLLPERYEHELTVDRTEFLGVVRRISLMAQRNSPLRLKFEEGTVTMSAQTPEVGEASESLPVAYTGEPLEIGFNAQFLRDGLESVDEKEVVLRLISPLRPGLIEAVGGDVDNGAGDAKFLYLIMPVRLNV